MDQPPKAASVRMAKHSSYRPSGLEPQLRIDNVSRDKRRKGPENPSTLYLYKGKDKLSELMT